MRPSSKHHLHPPDLNLRLFSHLVVMGIDTNQEELTYEKIFNNTIDASLIDIYPSIDKTKLPRYLENYKLWCFPEGLRIYNENLKLLNENILHESDSPQKSPRLQGAHEDEIENKDQLYHFVMTDDQRVKRFCSALLFHEQYCVRNDKKYHKKEKVSTLMPKIPIQNLIKNPLKLNEYHDLIYVPKSISIVSSLPVFEAQNQVLKYLYYNILRPKRKKQPERNIKIPYKFLIDFDKLLEKLNQKTKDDLIDEAWLSSFSIDRGEFFKSPAKDGEIQLKESQLCEFYLSAFFSLMTITTEPRETALLKPYSDEEEEIVRFRINQNIGINLTGFNFKAVFRKLSLLSILKIVKFILLERKILIFSKNPGDIPNITETLLSLISPLTWMCVYIPYLPIVMHDIVDSFMPYIIGMSKKYMKYVVSNHDLSDVVIVDVDEDKIVCEETFWLPRKPKDFILSEMDKLLRQVKLSPTHKSSDLWIDFTLKCRQLFNTFFLMLINNYANFFLFEKGDEGLDLPGLDTFSCPDYLKLFPKDDIPFMEGFATQTMMFSKFLEESYQVLYMCEIKKTEKLEDKPDEVSQFLQLLKTVNLGQNAGYSVRDSGEYIVVNSSGNLKLVEGVQNQSIKEALQRYKNPKKIDLTGYLVKYYYKLYHTQYDDKPKTNSGYGQKYPIEMLRDIDVVKINKGCQLLPRLQMEKMVDLNKMFGSGGVMGDVEDFSRVSVRASASVMGSRVSVVGSGGKREVGPGTGGYVNPFAESGIPMMNSQKISSAGNNSSSDNVNNTICVGNINNTGGAYSAGNINNTGNNSTNAYSAGNINNTGNAHSAGNINNTNPNNTANAYSANSIPTTNTTTTNTANKLPPTPSNKLIFSDPKPLYPSSENAPPSLNNFDSNTSIPYEEPPINSPTSLKKQNYFLYYQIFKRNTISEASPLNRKRIFDESIRSPHNVESEDVNMIKASLMWEQCENEHLKTLPEKTPPTLTNLGKPYGGNGGKVSSGEKFRVSMPGSFGGGSFGGDGGGKVNSGGGKMSVNTGNYGSGSGNYNSNIGNSNPNSANSANQPSNTANYNSGSGNYHSANSANYNSANSSNTGNYHSANSATSNYNSANSSSHTNLAHTQINFNSTQPAFTSIPNPFSPTQNPFSPSQNPFSPTQVTQQPFSPPQNPFSPSQHSQNPIQNPFNSPNYQPMPTVLLNSDTYMQYPLIEPKRLAIWHKGVEIVPQEGGLNTGSPNLVGKTASLNQEMESEKKYRVGVTRRLERPNSVDMRFEMMPFLESKKQVSLDEAGSREKWGDSREKWGDNREKWDGGREKSDVNREKWYTNKGK